MALLGLSAVRPHSDSESVTALRRDSSGTEPIVRRLQFTFDDNVTADWHPRLPEFASGANAISLLMPHAEPFVISAVRDAVPRIDDELLVRRCETWASQEAVHFKAHRSFNRSLAAQSSVARWLDRLGSRLFRLLRSRSVEFRLAFAAAFELIAFSSARWAEEGLQTYFDGADEDVSSLFLWHLAEEIEHKGIAHDVLATTSGARRKYPVAVVTAFVVLIGFTVVGGITLFLSRREATNPLRWLRLIGWGFSLAFVLLPILAVSMTRGFHPRQLVDPPWMKQWLLEYDPVTDTLPVWSQAGV